MKPDIEGQYGHAWKFDLKAIAQKIEMPEHASLTSWKIRAPWAHPVWDSYALLVLHLRPLPSLKPPHIYLPGATHEMMLHALQPDVDVPIDDIPWGWCLHPANFCAQWIERDDAAAEVKIEHHVREIVEGKLSPDTDWSQAWIKRFNASMIKGDPRTVGQTIIRQQVGGVFREVVHDPKPADGLPDLNPPWMKDRR